MRVRPYYIYQADITKGANHFRTPVKVGLEIMDKLRGWTSGLAIPYYVIDAPGGGGKIPMLPNYVVSHDENTWVLRNYKYDIYRYPDVKEEKAETKPARKRTPRPKTTTTVRKRIKKVTVEKSNQ